MLKNFFGDKNLKNIIQKNNVSQKKKTIRKNCIYLKKNLIKVISGK